MNAAEMKAQCLEIARMGCFVPPDGGAPSDEERLVSERIAAAIEAIPVEAGSQEFSEAIPVEAGSQEFSEASITAVAQVIALHYAKILSLLYALKPFALAADKVDEKGEAGG